MLDYPAGARSQPEPNGPCVPPARANGPGRRSHELPQGLKGRPFSVHSPNCRAVGPQAIFIAITTQAIGLGWTNAWPFGPKRGGPPFGKHPLRGKDIWREEKNSPRPNPSQVIARNSLTHNTSKQTQKVDSFLSPFILA